MPHIIIHSGDIVWCCPFPSDWNYTEHVEPISPRGVSVPLAMLRAGSYDHNLAAFTNWTYYESGHEFAPSGEYPYGRWVLDWDGERYPEGSVFYERSGPVGAPYVAPSNAATLPMALQALADQDIAVVSVLPGVVRASLGNRNDLTRNDILSDYAAFPGSWDAPDLEAPDPWGGGGPLSHTYASMALLTGAVTADGEAMSYIWGTDSEPDPRWTPPTLIPGSGGSFAQFLVGEILDLAERLGNRNTFDIALCVDSSGSFSGEGTIVVEVFRSIIDALRDQDANIHVAVSRFEEYDSWSFPWAGEFHEGRPFILQYPISSVNNPDDYNRMVEALADDPKGQGGDPSETQLEAFYQIATGAGFRGGVDRDEGPTGNTSTDDSGPAAYRGAPTNVVDSDGTIIGDLFDYIPPGVEDWDVRYDVPHVSMGLGYMVPGYSGDVPAFTSARKAKRAGPCG